MQEESADLKRYWSSIKPDSKIGLQKLSQTFLDLKKQYPYLSGIGFFGSRTKGSEHIDSDYDVCIFYDDSKMSSQSGRRDEWHQIITRLTSDLGGKLDHRILNPADGQRINISQRATDTQVDNFIETTAPFINLDLNDPTLILKTENASSQNLYSRFFMSVGTEVYKSRSYTLNRLKFIPNGEKYFQILMKQLEWFEKRMTKEGSLLIRYPKTISEADQFFKME